MSTVKNFTVSYNAVNEQGTFSEGDLLTGTVSLELSKETKAQKLFVKVKGDANTHWTRKRGDHTHSYTAHRRYFKLKQFLVPESSQETVLSEGIHVFKFSFNIPRESMPSSFKGIHGKIVYMVEAKLSRSWRMNSTAHKEIHFVSKSFPNFHSLMSPQTGSTDKGMGLFSKGHVHMDASVNKTGFAPGETVGIVAQINNSSSRNMTPKFSLEQVVVFHAQGDTNHSYHNLTKVAGTPVKPQTQQEERCSIQIPCDQPVSIQNCDIIKVEYKLKVYLDISFASDPEVVFPVVIFPPDLANSYQNAAMGPYPGGTPGGQNYSDFPPPSVPVGPYPAFPPSAGYGIPGVQGPAPPPAYSVNPQMYAGPPGGYPPQPPLMHGGYGNPASQMPMPFPYGSPSASSVSQPPPPPQQFYPPPSAPQIQPPSFQPPSAPQIQPPSFQPPSAPQIQPPSFQPPTAPQIQPPSSQPPSAPAVNPMPSAPLMNTDFLSQTNEAPPSYSVLFQSSDPEKSDPK